MTPDLATTLARLECCSSAPTAALDPAPGGDSDHGRPPGADASAAEPFRQRLAKMQRTLRRKCEQAVDLHALTLADAWAQRETEQIHRLALAELASLTGRTGAPPTRRGAHLDDPGALSKMVLGEGEGHPAGVVAVKFKLSEAMVRRMRLAKDRDAERGLPVEPASESSDRRAECRRMADAGMTERQIMASLGLSSTTQVRRALGKSA